MSGGVTWVWVVVGGILVALLLAQAVVVLGVLQRTAALLEAVEARLAAAGAGGAPGEDGPAVGAPLPELAVEDVQGTPAPLVATQGAPGTPGPPLVLLLLAPDCPHCLRLLDRLRAAPAPPTAAPVVAITDAAARPALRAAPLPPWVTVRYERDGAAARALGAAYVPMAVAVNGSGRIAAVDVPRTADDLARLGHLATGAAANVG